MAKTSPARVSMLMKSKTLQESSTVNIIYKPFKE